MSDPSGQRSRDRSQETARDPLEKKKDSELKSNQRLDVIPFLLRSTPFFHHEEFPGPSPTPLPAGRRRRARTDALRPRRPLVITFLIWLCWSLFSVLGPPSSPQGLLHPPLVFSQLLSSRQSADSRQVQTTEVWSSGFWTLGIEVYYSYKKFFGLWFTASTVQQLIQYYFFSIVFVLMAPSKRNYPSGSHKRKKKGERE